MEADDDDEYEDMEDEEDTVTQPPTQTNSQAADTGAGCDLSMIMEQSYIDQDFNLCLSGMQLHYRHHQEGFMWPK